MQFGMIGLGRMGSGLARRAMQAGLECVAYDANEELIAGLIAEGATAAGSLADLMSKLRAPRRVWVMIPASVTGDVITELASLMQSGDTIIDGSNSNYRDSVDHANKLATAGIDFVDVGTSGGVFGLERGYCLMIGGTKAAVEVLDPLFRALAPGLDAATRTPARTGEPSQPEYGYLHCGPAGAGHFAKMVHNGIEYGMMAALAEGLNLLAHAGGPRGEARDPGSHRFNFDLAALTEVWRRGSVVSSWLLDLTAEALAEDPELEGFSGRVSDSGEGRWTVQAAVDLGVPAHVLAASLFDRFSSRGNDDIANRLLSAMRKQFGGHRENGDSQ